VANYNGTDSLLLQSRAFLNNKLSAALQAIGWGAYDATGSAQAVTNAEARLTAALAARDAAIATPAPAPIAAIPLAEAATALNTSQIAVDTAQAGYDQAHAMLATAIAAQSGTDSVEKETTLQVMRLYLGCFGTSPATADSLQMPRWLSYISAGATLSNIANNFYDNAGPLENFSGVDNAGFIDAVYRNAFGRSPSSSEVNAWLVQFGSPIGHARGEVALDILNAAANYDGTDSILLADKTALAHEVTTALGALGWAQYDPAAAALAVQTAMQAVTDWDDQLQTAQVQFHTAQVQLQMAQLAWTQQSTNAVASSQLGSARSVAGPSTWTLFDAAGRLAKAIDALGHVTAYQYDAAGNRIAQIAYATPVDTSQFNSNTRAEQVAVAASSDDRATFFYYDADNRLVGQVDPEGYVLRNVYDGAGRLTETVRYASRAGGQPTASADFATLIPSATDDDQHTYRLYDDQGRVMGEVDAEGYLTEQQYDVAGNMTASIRYANRVTAPVTGASTLASVRPDASA
jgi:YD repeat-containing protein